MGCDMSGVVQPLLIAVEENETVLGDTPEKLQLNNVVLFHPGINTIVQLPSTDVMSLYSETAFCYMVPRGDPMSAGHSFYMITPDSVHESNWSFRYFSQRFYSHSS
jgi:hypothetical protein